MDSYQSIKVKCQLLLSHGFGEECAQGISGENIAF
jgi:hypothetical protein